MIDIIGFRVRNGTDDWLDLASESDKEDVETLKKLKPAIRSRNKKYDKLIKNYKLEPEKSIVVAHKKILKGFYSYAPKALKAPIRNRRYNDELRQCPFCGRPCRPEILDHFLPKNSWPEFSIYQNNLVNQCGACSSKKGEFYYCPDDFSAKFIHPLYSNLLSKLEFEYDINIPNASNLRHVEITLAINIPQYFAQKTKKRVELHLQHLDVVNYAITEGEREYLTCIRNSLTRRVNIITMLENEICLHTKPIDNDWKICIYKAMLKNPILLKHFEDHAP